ncbi:uncharacterized protein LOC105843063 isoform X1 [Hydra vulgaris]|uniref:uncharacterized protein LOC105843063 isoform X1 n=1 Tax=Hydra vulgaris TaxID=6087 RepID=UPI001F5FF238|nr:uncharacterized protein LOC105843063 [Hydra vulgaris]
MKSVREKDKENNKQTPKKAKPAPDFSKLHKQWDSKLQKGKAVTKKPLTDSQPFQLTCAGKYISPKRDSSFQVDEKAKESILDCKGIQDNQVVKKNRATIADCTRGVVRSSIPRPSFGCRAPTSRQSFSCHATKFPVHPNKSSDKDLNVLSVEKNASIVRHKNNTSIPPIMSFEGSFIDESNNVKIGKKNDEKEIENKNVLENRSVKAQQMQGFMVDFKTDNNALKSILSEEGLPFFNTPAKRSSQFGPLKKRSSERVAPFSRLSSVKNPVGRATLAVSRSNALGMSQLNKPRWSIFSRDSFSTKPDLLTWLKELAENPSFKKSICKEDSLAQSSTDRNLLSTSDIIGSKTKFNATVVGYQGGLNEMPTNKSILKDNNLEKISKNSLIDDIQHLKKDCSKLSSETKVDLFESKLKAKNEKPLVTFSHHSKFESPSIINKGLHYKTSPVSKCANCFVLSSNNIDAVNRIECNLKSSFTSTSSPLISINSKKTASLSTIKKVHWADIQLTKEVPSVCSQPTSHQIQFVMPAEHPLDKSPPKTLVNDYIQKLSSTKVNPSTYGSKNEHVISWSDVLRQELLTSLNNTSENWDHPGKIDSNPVSAVSDNLTKNLINFNDPQFDLNDVSSFHSQNNLQSTLITTPLVTNMPSTSKHDSQLIEHPSKMSLIDLDESFRKDCTFPFSHDTLIDKEKESRNVNCLENTFDLKTNKLNSYLEETSGDNFIYIKKDEQTSVKLSEQDIETSLEKSLVAKNKKKSKHRNSYLEKICGDFFTYISDDENPLPSIIDETQTACSLDHKVSNLNRNNDCLSKLKSPNSQYKDEKKLLRLDTSSSSANFLMNNLNSTESLTNLADASEHLPAKLNQVSASSNLPELVNSSIDSFVHSQDSVTKCSLGKDNVLIVSTSSPSSLVICSSVANIRSPSMLVFPQSTMQFGKTSLSRLTQEPLKSSILRPSKLLESKEIKNNDSSNSDIKTTSTSIVKTNLDSELLFRFASLTTNPNDCQNLSSMKFIENQQNILKPSILSSSLNRSNNDTLKTLKNVDSFNNFSSNLTHPLFSQAQFPVNPLFKKDATIINSDTSCTNNLILGSENSVQFENNDVDDDEDLCLVFSRPNITNLTSHRFQRTAFSPSRDCLPSEEYNKCKNNLIGVSEENSAFRHIAPRCNVFPKIFYNNIAASKPSEQLKQLQYLMVNMELPNKYDAMLDAEVSVCSKFVEINQMFIKSEMLIRHGALDPVSQLLTFGDGKHFVPINVYA